MEQLTRTELMLVRGCLLAEVRQLEADNEELEKKVKMTDIDRVNYAYNKGYIEKYQKILQKIS